MMQLAFEPAANASVRCPFVQTITLSDSGKPVGSVRWMIADADEGAIQVLDLSVVAARQRQGYGRQLMEAVVDQARKLLSSGGNQPRRIFVLVSQKKQVIARAFLTARGFHHVSTLQHVHKDEDLLVYLSSLV